MSGFTFREWHHGYLGLLLLAAGVRLHLAWLIPVGAVLVADDAFQHVAESLRGRAVRSPLHQLYARTLWRIPMVRSVNRWLDALVRKLVSLLRGG